MTTKATKTELKTFNITGRVSVDVSVELLAEDWADAITEANNFGTEKFITVEGDCIDSRPVEIIGAWVDE
jgi:hypothetical protein